MTLTLATKEAGNELDTRPGQRQTARSARQSSIVPYEGCRPRLKRLTDAQAELAGEHWEWAMKLAALQAKKAPHLLLDIQSAAAVGVCEAAAAFIPERGVKFQSYAARRVNGAILDFFRGEANCGFRRARQRVGHFVPDTQSIDRRFMVEGREESLSAAIPTEEESIGWEEESIDFVYSHTRRLANPSRSVVRLYYCHGLTMKQVGARLGLSESRVSQLLETSLVFLRGALAIKGVAS